MITLSIIIVSYNTRDLLVDCLRSLPREDDLEVFVVDNASIDGSADAVAEQFPKVNLIRNATNVGFAPANNQALRLCRGRYIMLLNSDTEMLEGTLSGIIHFMDGKPDAAVVGCKLLNTDGSLQPSVTSFPNIIKDSVGILLKGSVLSNTPSARKWLSSVAKMMGTSASRFDDHSDMKEIDYPRGACFTVRREALEEAGLLDEEYFFTGEELDFCYRVKQKGWKVYYYPQVAVIHHDHGASKSMMGKVFVQTRKSALYFYEKHYGWKRTELMKACVSLTLMMKIIAGLVSLLLFPKRRSITRGKIESCAFIIRLHYSKSFRRQNVFTEMPFRYN